MAIRFSKENVLVHLWAEMEIHQIWFESVENKPYDGMNGTSQCNTEKGLEAHQAVWLLRKLYEDIQNRNLKQPDWWKETNE